MSMFYQECSPAHRLRPYIRLYGVLKKPAMSEEVLKVGEIFPPSLSKVLVIVPWDSSSFWIEGLLFKGLLPTSYIAPHLNQAFRIWVDKPMEMFAVMFQPGAFRHFFPFSVAGMEDLLIPTADINDAGLTEFCKRARAADSFEARVELANDYFLKILQGTEPDRTYSNVLVEQMLVRPDVSIQELANSLPVSERQLRRRFLREIGVTPKKYQSQIRFSKALYLLSCFPQMDLWEIGYRCGYTDHSHFIRAFRKAMFVTPGAFRKEVFDIAEVVSYKDVRFGQVELVLEEDAFY